MRTLTVSTGVSGVQRLPKLPAAQSVSHRAQQPILCHHIRQLVGAVNVRPAITVASVTNPSKRVILVSVATQLDGLRIGRSPPPARSPTLRTFVKRRLV